MTVAYCFFNMCCWDHRHPTEKVKFFPLVIVLNFSPASTASFPHPFKENIQRYLVLSLSQLSTNRETTLHTSTFSWFFSPLNFHYYFLSLSLMSIKDVIVSNKTMGRKRLVTQRNLMKNFLLSPNLQRRDGRIWYEHDERLYLMKREGREWRQGRNVTVKMLKVKTSKSCNTISA